jgi:hypothetical protein
MIVQTVSVLSTGIIYQYISLLEFFQLIAIRQLAQSDIIKDSDIAQYALAS